MARKVTVEFIGDTKDLDRAFGKTRLEAAKTGGTVGTLGKTAKTVAGFVGVAGLAGALVGAAKAGMGFGKELSGLQAVTSANASTMKKFRDQAMKAGADTAFSATEAAKAQTELAKGGLSVKAILDGGLNGALALAAAGEMDLADAASTTANALNLFGLKGRDAGHVADALATAANATTADVADFALAMKAGGSAAKAAGLSFDQTTVWMEALATAGIAGSDAGTSIKAALTQLAAPSKKAAEAAKKLGLNFFDANGNFKSMADVSAMLRDKFKGLTAEQKLSAASALAGTDGMRALLALADTGPKRLGEYADGLKKQGTAAATAAAKQNNLAGDLEKLQGSLETLAIQITSALMPAARLLVQGLGWLVDALGSVIGRVGDVIGWFKKHQTTTEALATAVGTAVVAFTAFTAAMAVKSAVQSLGLAMSVLKTVYAAQTGTTNASTIAVLAHATAAKASAAAQWLLNAAMSANPIGLVITAIAALTAGFVALYKKSETFRDLLNTVWDALKAGFTWVRDNWKLLLAILTGPIGLAVLAISGHVDDIVAFFKALPGRIVNAIQSGTTAIYNAGKWVVNRVVDGFKTVTDLLGSVGGWFRNRVSDFVKAEISGLKSIGTWIVNRVVDGFTTVTDLLGSVGGWIKNRVVEFIKLEIQGFSQIGAWIINRVMDGARAVSDGVQAVGGWIKNRLLDGLTAVKDKVLDIGGSVIGWIVDGIKAGFKSGANAMIGFVNAITHVINKIPGVPNIPAVPKLATGGKIGAHAQALAAGGKVTRPLAIVGEEAPRHPEYVIPTNPAYRGRAIGLTRSLMGELGIGVPGFALGGVLDDTWDRIERTAGTVGDALSGGVTGDVARRIERTAGTVGSVLADGGKRLIKQLPNPADMLPDWLLGSGKWVIGKVRDWVKKQTASLFGGGGGAGGQPGGGGLGTFDGLPVANWIIPILRWARAHGWGGRITSGYRSHAHNVAQGRNYFSNHETTGYPGGAIDVGGWGARAQGAALAQVLARYTGSRRLVWAGPVIGDWGHFSATGHAKGGIIGQPFVGSYATGGVVPRDGLARVHAGETITPAAFQPVVKVFIGDRELTDIVRVQIDEHDRAGAAAYAAGGVR